MTSIIDIRNKLIDLIGQESPDLLGHVVSGKMDVVEVFPSASVFLGDISTEPASFKGGVTRTSEIHIAIYRHHASLESEFATEANTIEQAIYTARKSFGQLVKHISVTGISMSFTPDSKSTEGALHLTVSTETQKQLTT